MKYHPMQEHTKATLPKAGALLQLQTLPSYEDTSAEGFDFLLTFEVGNVLCPICWLTMQGMWNQ